MDGSDLAVRGCSRVSEGCGNCYAEKIAARFSDVGKPFHGFADIGPRAGDARWTGKVELLRDKLDEPLSWRKPARVFVNSMSDLFHEKLTDHEIARVFAVMAQAKRHTFQVLTKRPERALNFFMRVSLVDAPAFLVGATGGTWPLPNVWLGVSVEDQKTADERIPILLQMPAAIRFVSYEPALGPVEHGRFLTRCRYAATDHFRCCDAYPHMVVGLDWVIVGGESGPGARPFDIAWARSVVEQCKAAGVACFVKQLGARPVHELPGDGPTGQFRSRDGVREYARTIHTLPLRDRKGGDPSEWPEDLRVREFPEARA